MQYPRQGGTGTTSGRGRGQGQAASSSPTRGRQGSQAPQPQGQARVFALTHHEAAADTIVIIGKILLFDKEVCALIDPGSTHSFIASATASCLHQKPGVLGKDLTVSTPLGECVIVQTVYHDCALRINMVEFPADLIVFPLLELDIILGMDWLTRHRAVVNCYTKEVIFEVPGHDKVIFCGERQAVPGCLVSAMTAFRLIQEGCQAYLAHVVDST